jgi:hypothetical protein
MIVALAGAASCSESTEPRTEGGSVPAGVRAAINGSTVKLDWDPVPGALSYRVYMAEVGGVRRINVGELPGNMTHSHNNTVFDHPSGLLAATKYYFVVTAVHPGNMESRESCEVTAKIGTNEATNC